MLPALAGGVSVVFAVAVGRQYARRRRPHQLAWTLGLAAYAAASLLEAYVAARGWTLPLYRAYVPLASAPVGLLGAGTVYLLRAGRWGHAFAALMGALVAAALVGPHLLDLPASGVEGRGLDLGAKALPPGSLARVAFLLLNVLGGLALVGGALWSWWRTRAAGVLLIGLGALLPAAGGALSTLFGLEDRVALQFFGVVVMLAGYARSREAPLAAAPPGAVAAR